MEITLGLVIAAIMVFVAGFFAFRQRVTVRALRNDPELGDEDRHYLRKQVRRRLLCCFLMMVFAGFLVGWFFLDHDLGNLAPVDGVPASDEDKDKVRFLVYYWIVALAVLMLILLIASLDFLATARFGFKRQKELERDRRAMMEDEATRLRRRRQEMN